MKVVGAETRGAVCPPGRDGAMDLPARRGLFVTQQNAEAAARRGRGGGHAGRAGADDRQVMHRRGPSAR